MSDDRKRILNMVREGRITVEEAGELLSAVGGDTAGSETGVPHEAVKKVKYLRVLVEDKERGANVNIRVPMALLRAGIKLGAILPDHAREKVDEALKDKGFNIDLSKADPETIEQLITSLSELTVDIDTREEGKAAKVRIFCE